MVLFAPRLKLFLYLLDGTQFLFPEVFEAPRDQAVFRFASLILPLGPRCFIANSLDPKLPLPLERCRFAFDLGQGAGAPLRRDPAPVPQGPVARLPHPRPNLEPADIWGYHIRDSHYCRRSMVGCCGALRSVMRGGIRTGRTEQSPVARPDLPAALHACSYNNYSDCPRSASGWPRTPPTKCNPDRNLGGPPPTCQSVCVPSRPCARLAVGGLDR